MILTKITNLAKICHFIRRTSCKLIQIFANPLALFFQIRHFRHCMPTFLGMSVLCSMLWQQGCPKLSRHNVSNPKLQLFLALNTIPHLPHYPSFSFTIQLISLLLKFYNFVFYVTLRTALLQLISTLANVTTFLPVISKTIRRYKIKSEIYSRSSFFLIL